MKRNKQIQLAFNHTFSEFVRIIDKIPHHSNIIIEAGTPLIKREGIAVIAKMRHFWPGAIYADLKVVDGSKDEVQMAKANGASYITALGTSSVETLKLFVETCRQIGINSVIDMINTPKPLKAIWEAHITPNVAMIHRGRDEENSFGKVIQYKEIAKIKGKWDILVGAAGGVDKKEMQSAFFNGADIVVINVVRPTDPWTGIIADRLFQKELNDFLQMAK